jgi:hypothetical protein
VAREVERLRREHALELAAVRKDARRDARQEAQREAQREAQLEAQREARREARRETQRETEREYPHATLVAGRGGETGDMTSDHAVRLEALRVAHVDVETKLRGKHAATLAKAEEKLKGECAKAVKEAETKLRGEHAAELEEAGEKLKNECAKAVEEAETNLRVHALKVAAVRSDAEERGRRKASATHGAEMERLRSEHMEEMTALRQTHLNEARHATDKAAGTAETAGERHAEELRQAVAQLQQEHALQFEAARKGAQAAQDALASDHNVRAEALRVAHTQEAERAAADHAAAAAKHAAELKGAEEKLKSGCAVAVKEAETRLRGEHAAELEEAEKKFKSEYAVAELEEATKLIGEHAGNIEEAVEEARKAAGAKEAAACAALAGNHKAETEQLRLAHKKDLDEAFTMLEMMERERKGEGERGGAGGEGGRWCG